MVLSDAFGIESDESKEVQDKKSRYIKLRDQDDRSNKEQVEFEKLKEFLTNRPLNNISKHQIPEEHANLLQQIEKELQEMKS